MADPTLSAIDRIFDFIDSGVEATDRVLNRGKYTEEQHRSRRARRGEVIDTQAAEKVSKKAAPSSSASSASPSATGIVKRPQFRIVEAIAPRSGDTIYVVTDGGNARAECSTREMAEKILRGLEAAP